MQDLTLTITGRIPSKKNSKRVVCRGKRPVVLNQDGYDDWHEEASWQIKQFIPDTPLQKCKSISLTFTFPDNRRPDLTNKAESIMDLLVDMRVIEDDCWQVTGDVILTSAGVDKNNPHVKVIISY